MNIKIDAREKGSIKLVNTRKDRAKDYYTSKGHDVEITRLDYGDYLFDDKVVFELKTISDFMSSVGNGSVFEEVANQTMNYKYSYLIIVGSLPKYINASYYVFNKNKKSKRNWAILQHNKFDGAVRRIRTMVPVITCHLEEKAFKEMLLQSQKCLNNKAYGGVKRTIKSKDIIIHALCGCSGVNYKKANKIKETLKLENISDLSKVTSDDLKSVDGVGPKTAEKIITWLNG